MSEQAEPGRLLGGAATETVAEAVEFASERASEWGSRVTLRYRGRTLDSERLMMWMVFAR